jgi:hypothetical protein
MSEIINNDQIITIKSDITNFLNTLSTFGINDQINDFKSSFHNNLDLIEKTLRESKYEKIKLQEKVDLVKNNKYCKGCASAYEKKIKETETKYLNNLVQ